MIEFLIGFDFGHGETSATYIPLYGPEAGKRNALTILRGAQADSRKIPSVIYKNGIQGDDGTIRFTYSLRKSDHWMPCLAFKDKISNLRTDPQRMQAHGAFIREIYNKVLDNNDFLHRPTEADPEGNFLIYIACPTRWTEEEKTEYKNFFEESLGHEVEWIINESDAAFFAHRRNGLVLVVDFGSSTIDYTLMHDFRKIDIDHTSSNLGARQVEQLMLADYKKHSTGRNSYAECVPISRQVLDDWTEIDPYLLLKLRKEKEDSYTREESSVVLRYTLDYDVTGEESDATRYYGYIFRNIDALLRQEVNEGRNDGYITRVEQNFRELRSTIEEELEQRGLRLEDMTIILSGGATMMPWIRTSLMEVFDIPEAEMQTRILRDDNPSYVVSNGVAEYAYAKYKTIVEILKDVDTKFDYKSEFIDTFKDTLLECQVEELHKLRNIYVENYSTYEDLIPLLKAMNSTLTEQEDFSRRVNERFNCKLNAALNRILHDVILANFGEEVNIPLNIDFPTLPVGVDSSYLDEGFQKICNSEHFFGAIMDKARSAEERAKVMDDLIEWERNNPFVWNPGEEFLENLQQFVLHEISVTIENHNLFEIIR